MSNEVENIVLRRVKLCISFINKIVGRVSAKHREIKKKFINKLHICHRIVSICISDGNGEG